MRRPKSHCRYAHLLFVGAFGSLMSAMVGSGLKSLTDCRRELDVAFEAALRQHMTTVLVLGVLHLALFFPPFAQAVEEAPRLTDREIIEQLTRLEEGQKALGQRFDILERHVNERIDDLERRVDQRFDAVDQRIDDLERRVDQRFDAVDQRFEAVDQRFEAVDQRFEAVSREIAELRQIMLWGFGVMFAGMFALTGFVLWDRRTALAPAVGRVEALEKRERLLEEVLRSYALKVPELAEELRKARLL